MDWQKPSPELSRILGQAAEPFAAIESRKMFGCPALFVNGNMVGGVYGDGLFLRLPEDAREELRTGAGAEPFEPMPGRVMKDYVVMPEAVWGDPEALDGWMHRAVEFVAAMPPKQPKGKRERAG